MAAYGSFLYGQDVYTRLEVHGLTWSVEVDWQDLDAFTDEGSLVSGMSWNRGRENYIQAQGNGFEEIQPGTLYITLFNDGRFDPYNSESALYPFVEPGHLVKVGVSIDGGTALPVFAGVINDIQPVDEDHIKLEVQDGWAFLDTDFSTAIQTRISISMAIENILNAVNYPFAYDLETDTDVIPYWWGEGNAKDEIGKLVQSSLGLFFTAADGKATFQDRHISESGAMAVDDSDVAYEVSLKMPWETRRNKIQIQVHPLKLETGATVWTLSEAVAVPGGGTVEIWAEYSDSCPAMNVVVDSFAAHILDDETSTDVSGDFSITLDSFSKTARLSISNNGENTGYLTHLILTGDAIEDQDPVKIVAENTEARKRIFNMDLEWQQSANVGLDLAAYLQESLAFPAANPTIQIEADPALQFGFELGDLVNLTISDKHIFNKIFRVGGISGEWTREDGQAVLSTFYLELLPDALTQYFVVDVSSLDIDELGY